MNQCNPIRSMIQVIQITSRSAATLPLYCLLSILTLALPSMSIGLESDRDQPIQIESDRAEFRELEGLTIYSGNVKMSQGSILLMADEVAIHSKDGNVSHLTATGNRAYYEQLPAAGEDKICLLYTSDAADD